MPSCLSPLDAIEEIYRSLYCDHIYHGYDVHVSNSDRRLSLYAGLWLGRMIEVDEMTYGTHRHVLYNVGRHLMTPVVAWDMNAYVDCQRQEGIQMVCRSYFESIKKFKPFMI